MFKSWITMLAQSFLLTCAASAQPPAAPAPVVVQIEVDSGAEETWSAWTSEDGVRSFFASEARVEPRVGGAYEIYFLPGQPEGLRGSEGATILALERPRRLMFSWNAPVRFGPLRHQLTVVEIRIEPKESRRSLVTLTHSGWGAGEEWEEVRRYFAGAWPGVLASLERRLGAERY